MILRGKVMASYTVHRCVYVCECRETLSVLCLAAIFVVKQVINVVVYCLAIMT